MSTAERMKKIEGQLARVRWFNRCLIACILLSLAVWFILKTFTPETAWAGSSVKEIRANRFVVEDENGNPRAILAVFKDGPRLLLVDENGKPRAGMAVENDMPMLMLIDENGKPRLSLEVDKKGPRLALMDKNGKDRARLGTGQTTTADGKVSSFPESSLILFGADGKGIWSAP